MIAIILNLGCCNTFGSACFFRMARSFRPCRLLTRVESLHDILIAIFATKDECFSLILVIFGCKIAYAIMGQQVSEGDCLALVHACSVEEAELAAAKVQAAVTLSDTVSSGQPVVYEVIEG